MRIKTICNKKRVGIMVGNIGVGLIAFPWIHVWGQPKYNISFWEWLICLPRISFPFFAKQINFTGYIQFRFMWFIVQVMR